MRRQRPFTAAFKASHPDWRTSSRSITTYNPAFKGVIAAHGSVGVSGNVNGHVTLYSDGSIGVLDNLRLTNNADTSVPAPLRNHRGQRTSSRPTTASMRRRATITTRLNMRGGSSDLWVESTVFALQSWGAEGLVQDPGVLFVPLQQPCNGQNYARGCLHVQGSIIQDSSPDRERRKRHDDRLRIRQAVRL